MDESKKCGKCPDIFRCFISKQFWLHEEPKVITAKGCFNHDVDSDCYDRFEEQVHDAISKDPELANLTDDEKKEIMEQSLRKAGREFAIYLYNHADEDWVFGMLDTFHIKEEDIDKDNLSV